MAMAVRAHQQAAREAYAQYLLDHRDAWDGSPPIQAVDAAADAAVKAVLDAAYHAYEDKKLLQDPDLLESLEQMARGEFTEREQPPGDFHG
jgi:hypothetical protein